MALQNYAWSDSDNIILRKILQNQLALVAGSVGAGVSQQTADFRQSLRTYSAAGTVVAAASATDAAILPGNAGSLVYVTKIVVSGIQGTAGLALMKIIKRSDANTGGTTTGSPASVPHFSTDAAAGSSLLLYTANPSGLGAAVGNVDTRYVPIQTATGNGNPVEFNFGALGKPILLSGVAEGLALNLNSVTLTGCTLGVRYEWYEI